MKSDSMKKLPGKGFQRPRPPLIRMDEEVKTNEKNLF
jgi:hypothetical protein